MSTNIYRFPPNYINYSFCGERFCFESPGSLEDTAALISSLSDQIPGLRDSLKPAVDYAIWRRAQGLDLDRSYVFNAHDGPVLSSCISPVNCWEKESDMTVIELPSTSRYVRSLLSPTFSEESERLSSASPVNEWEGEEAPPTRVVSLSSRVRSILSQNPNFQKREVPRNFSPFEDFGIERNAFLQEEGYVAGAIRTFRFVLRVFFCHSAERYCKKSFFSRLRILDSFR